MCEAESPMLRVIRGAVGDEVRLIRKGVHVRGELIAGYDSVDRHAVADDVKVAVGEIDNHRAVECLDVGAAHVPFEWDLPIQCGRGGRNLVQDQRDATSDCLQGRAKAITCYAAAQRKELPNEAVQPLSRCAGSWRGTRSLLQAFGQLVSPIPRRSRGSAVRPPAE